VGNNRRIKASKWIAGRRVIAILADLE